MDSAVTQLASDPTSVAVARRFVATTLEEWGRGDQIDEATLLISEVVTNAVMHAGTAVDVRVIQVGAVIRVEVGDGNPARPVVRESLGDGNPARPVRESGLPASGRGLRIVDEMSADWGSYPVPEDGKVVWFEIA